MNVACTRCGSACYLSRDSAANGSTQVFWWCAGCARVADPRHPFVSLDYVTRVLRLDVASLPVIERYPDTPLQTCAVQGCNRTDVEYHHFAPRHLFEADSETWPTGYLCRSHHAEWHAKVTPNMSARRNGQKPAPVSGRERTK